LQGDHVVKEVFPKKVAELNELLQVRMFLLIIDVKYLFLKFDLKKCRVSSLHGEDEVYLYTLAI